MALQRHWLNPTNWVTELSNLPNDGLDHEVIFEGGVYDLTQGGSPLLVDHSAGGLLLFRNFNTSKPLFQIPGFSGVDYSIKLVALRMHLLGLHCRGMPFSDTSGGGAADIRFILNGGDTPALRINPTEIRVHGCRFDGELAGVRMIPSNDPTLYTSVHVTDNVIEDVGRFAPMTLEGINDPDYVATPLNAVDDRFFYAHVSCVNNTGFGRNSPGPDGTGGDAANWGGTNSNHHFNGTLWMDLGHIAGHSTYTEQSTHWRAEIWGSDNHDFHAMRVGDIIDKDVKMYWRDCVYIGEWRANHKSGSGGGGPWSWYYHSGGELYDTTDSDERPQLHHDNCTFKFIIYPEAAGDEAESDVVFPLVHCGSSATYHFWDCQFVFDDRLGFFANPINRNSPVGAILSQDAGASDVTVEAFFHNCKWTPPAVIANGGYTVEPAMVYESTPPGTSNAHTQDAGSRSGLVHSEWRRQEAVLPFPDTTRDVVIRDPGAEFTDLSVWRFVDNAGFADAVLETDEVHSGAHSIDLRLNIGAGGSEENAEAYLAINQRYHREPPEVHVLTFWGYHDNASTVESTLIRVSYNLDQTSVRHLQFLTSSIDGWNRTWKRFHLRFTPPTGYDSIEIGWDCIMRATSPPIFRSDQFFIDDVELVIEEPPE